MPPQSPPPPPHHIAARDRLLSIRYDAERFLRPILEAHPGVPVFANERAGSWYALAAAGPAARSCCFKSTDGHRGTHAVSLRRLNLRVAAAASSSPVGAVLLVDASVRKTCPDSLSRTVPLWACALNRVCARYRSEGVGGPSVAGTAPFWDERLHLPPCVGEEERAEMEAAVDSRADALYGSGAVVDPARLVRTLARPLRAYWAVHSEDGAGFSLDGYPPDRAAYSVVVCLSCSCQAMARRRLDVADGTEFRYAPGAADDHELWSRGMDAELFRRASTEILGGDPSDADVDARIDGAVAADVARRVGDRGGPRSLSAIAGTGISVGTRRAGRPPACWTEFGAVLNVTDAEYEDCAAAPSPSPSPAVAGRYLQMPVAEGKRDRHGLERWMAAGLAFVAVHLAEGRKVLVHCNQGRDRSVAVAIAVVALLCEPETPLRLRWAVRNLTRKSLCRAAFGDGDGGDVGTERKEHGRSSGMSAALVEKLMGRKGRDLVLAWIEDGLGLGRVDVEADGGCLANKETLRKALHHLLQYREEANPTRATMQKLNRFFMSSRHEASDRSAPKA